MTADDSNGTPAARCHLAAMKIGDILIHDGRRYVVCGFDPEGVSARLIYVEDTATKVRSTLPFEEAGLPRESGARRLRLVTEAESKEPRSDVL
jgi:hypothetical protein